MLVEVLIFSDDFLIGEDMDYDIDDKVEIFVYVKRMFWKKGVEDILDVVYNRYIFNDEGLFKWFVDDESKYMWL